MAYSPYYFEYIQSAVGFTFIPTKKECYDFTPKSTEQKVIDDRLNYFNSTRDKIYITLITNLFNSIDDKSENLIVKNKFYGLLNNWQEETVTYSDITKKCTHPSYQQIIGMGESVLPYIIDELKTNPNHWFWALKAITGEDPVPDDKKGNIKDMIGIWIEWIQNKYL